MLAQNRSALRRGGICYPASMTQHAGHHELAWSLKGWNQRLLGTYNGPQTTTEILATFITEANEAGVSTLLLSSEDLSLLSDDEWNTFFAVTHDVCASLDVDIDEVCVTWSRRFVASSARSMYSTLVLLGLTYDFRSVDPYLREHFRKVQTLLARLQSPADIRLRRLRVKWRRKGFIEHWLRRVLPTVDATQMSRDAHPVNVSHPLVISEALALDNVTRNVVFDKRNLVAWALYQNEDSIALQREARGRFLTSHTERE